MSDIALLPCVAEFLERPLGHFIDGQSYYGSGTGSIAVVNPATEEVVARVATAEGGEVRLAVAAARKAFQGCWADTSPDQRGRILNRIADALESHAEEIAQIETLSTGKSIHFSRMLDVGQSAQALRYYAGWATKISGETLIPSFPSLQGEKYTAFTRREPVGVVAAIVPWNFSTLIAFWKIGAALATGCTVVVKPSEFTPLTLLRVAELACEAGLPAGVLNIVNGDGGIGQQLIAHPDVAKISFTGSVPTGKAVGQSAMEADLTRCTLELGGKNAAVLLKDASVEDAVTGLLQTSYVHQGQVCAAPERLFVHRSLLPEVAGRLSASLAKLRIGSPLDENVQFGPISNKPQYTKLLKFFARAHAESEVLYGGKAVSGRGYFVEPTLVLAGSPQETLMKEETFGPVVTLLPYDDEEQMLTWLNDSPFGLAASLWSNDLSRVLRMIPRIQAGTVWVNMHTFLDPAVPFGGIKASGLGRELGSAFIEDYTELKSVIIRY